MAALWRRIPAWVDWLVAAVLAIVVLNLNVTSAGDPLSSIGEGSSVPGISPTAKAVFYGTLALSGVILTATGIVLDALRHTTRSRLVLTASSFATVAGVLGLLLDYRDGPVRTVQLIVYVALAFGVIRLARVAAPAIDADQ